MTENKVTSKNFRLEAPDEYGVLESTIDAIERARALPPGGFGRAVGVIEDAGLPLAVDGRFRNSKDKWVEIALNPYVNPFNLPSVLAHETGHLIDAALTGFRGGYASHTTEAFAEWRKIVASTRSIAQMRSTKDALGASGSLSEDERSDLTVLEYLLEDHEIFARCYAQYVTTRSGDMKMTGWLQNHLKSQRGKTILRQWEENDFAPVTVEMDRIFEKIGWLKP